jgi:positive regulator of sigma E activity
MKKQLVVISKTPETITLESTDKGCNSCSSKGVCGVGVLSKLTNKTITQKNNGEQVGDLLELEINNNEFIKNSLLLYIFPIVALFLGSNIAGFYFPENTFYQAIISILFLITAFLVLKFKRHFRHI